VSAKEAKETPPPKRTGRRWLRAAFRALRILILLVAFVVIVTGFFLNKIGLPDFAKERVVQYLRSKGWEAEFSRLRLRWYRGIVADDVHVRRTNDLRGPHLFVRQAECGIDFSAWRKLKIEVRSFKIRDGRIVWLLHKGSEAHPPFVLNNATGELYFERNDQWDLRFLNGELLGSQVHFTGKIANGSLIREWRAGEKRREPRRDPVALWEEVVRNVTELRFSAQPQLDGHFSGDAADFRTLEGNLRFRVPFLTSPWGSGTNVLLTTRLFPETGNAVVQADVAITAGEVTTPWGHANEFRLNLEFEPRYTNAWPTNFNLACEVKNARARWGTADYALLTARLFPCPTNKSIAQSEIRVLANKVRSPHGDAATANFKALAVHPYTNWQPSLVSGSGEIDGATNRFGSAAEAKVEFNAQVPPESEWFLTNTNLAWPERVRTLPFNTRIQFSQLKLTNAEAAAIGAEINWRWPHMHARANGSLYGGDFKAEAEVNAETMESVFDGHSTFDVHRVAPLLGAKAQRFMRSYSWQAPPHFRAAGRVTLPPWTNGLPQFGEEMLQSLSLAGFFDVGAGAYKSVTFSSAQSPFTYTNNIWRVENLALRRPEGRLQGTYTSFPEKKEFHWKFHSTVDPKVFRSLFDTNGARAFDLFELTVPPSLEGEVWGNWRNPERTGARARVHAFDFKFRGESMDEVSGDLVYTNSFLGVISPQMKRAVVEKAEAPGIGVDFQRKRIWFTNAFGNLNPQVVSRCIGTKIGKIMADYIFDEAPTTRLNGTVDMRKGSDEDDLHFEISGGAFRWKDFRFQQLAGNIDWIGRTMVLTNVQGIFHGGRAAGYAHFEFPRRKGAEFSFKLSLAEVDFHSFMSDLSGKTNRLEGMLNGELTVVAANTEQPNSWMGYGSVHLRDGLLWDIPVFGLFSPILNAFAPGLGNSRAKQGSAEFLITNSVISTKDLDVQATAMRMHFEGTVDFEKRINSRAEAELLRDLPGIGLVLSKILWPVTKIFEYQVTGTLGEPKAEPLYIIPKVLLFPLQPFKILKDLVTPDPKPPPKPLE
jgi:hypothetical protein